MERTPVKSSQVAAVGYDPATKTLEVEFLPQRPKGATQTISRVYSYYDVEQADADAMRSEGVSIGKVFGLRVKGVHKYAQTSVVLHHDNGTTEEISK